MITSSSETLSSLLAIGAVDQRDVVQQLESFLEGP